MTINQYDRVLLKDGRTGCVVEINKESNIFDIDIGSSPKDWETLFFVSLDDIDKVIE